MRIRNRKVPLPLSSLSPIPLSDPQFSRSPVVQLRLHNSPHQSLLQEPQKDEYFDLHLPSDRLNQPIGGGSEGHDDCSHGAGPQEEKKVLLEEGDGIKGGELLKKSIRLPLQHRLQSPPTVRMTEFPRLQSPPTVRMTEFKVQSFSFTPTQVVELIPTAIPCTAIDRIIFNNDRV